MLTEKQKEAVRLLCVEGKGVCETAALLGIHRCTLWRWSCKKDFEKEWNRLLKETRKQWNKARMEHRKKWKRCLMDIDKQIASVKAGNGPYEALTALRAERARCVHELYGTPYKWL